MKNTSILLLIAFACLACLLTGMKIGSHNTKISAGQENGQREPDGPKYTIYRVIEGGTVYYDCGLPDGGGYDFLTLPELDSVVQGYELQGPLKIAQDNN